MSQLLAEVIDDDTVRVLDLPIAVAPGMKDRSTEQRHAPRPPRDTHFATNGDAGSVVGQTFQGMSTTVTVRLHTLDVLVAVHVVGSVEGRLYPGDSVKVTVDGSHAVVEPVDGSQIVP